jgi:hypothetical protein
VRVTGDVTIAGKVDGVVDLSQVGESFRSLEHEDLALNDGL